MTTGGVYFVGTYGSIDISLFFHDVNDDDDDDNMNETYLVVDRVSYVRE